MGRSPWVVALGAIVGLFVVLALIGGFISFVEAVGGDDDDEPAASSGDAGQIRRTDYGAQWPFTVPEGTLRCEAGVVTFESGGTTYALNEAARRRGYAAIARIRADDAATGKKEDLSPVVSRGLELCS